MSTAIEVVPVETQSAGQPVNVFASRASSVLEYARTVVITNDEDDAAAADFLRKCKLLASEFDTFIRPVVESAHASWKRAKETENSVMAPIKEAQQIVSRTMGAYRAQIEADRQAAIALERARLKSEQNAAVADFADQLAAQGREDEARAVIAAKPEILEQDIKVADARPVTKGTATRTTWKFEITDESLLPRGYLTPDVKAIGAYVRARGLEAKIPGVRVFPETATHIRKV